jgi:hypothetical protein
VLSVQSDISISLSAYGKNNLPIPTTSFIHEAYLYFAVFPTLPHPLTGVIPMTTFTWKLRLVSREHLVSAYRQHTIVLFRCAFRIALSPHKYSYISMEKLLLIRSTNHTTLTFQLLVSQLVHSRVTYALT